MILMQGKLGRELKIVPCLVRVGSIERIEACGRLPYHLHEYLLALWGCPLRTMVDPERLVSKICKKRNRYFRLSSSTISSTNVLERVSLLNLIIGTADTET